MAIQFSNDGASIKVITPAYEKTVQKDLTKFSINEETGEHISMRSGKFGDQFRYSDITSPVTANIDALLTLLESWLESSEADGGGVVFDAAQLDAGGRLPVALPVVLGDYKFINTLLPEQFDTEVNGGGAISHNAATNSADLTTAGIGDWAIIQSNQWHPYFNGKAQLPMVTYINLEAETGAQKIVGYYHSSTVSPFNTVYDGMWITTKTDGKLYFEIYRDGTEVLSIAQEDWNTDKLDGTGSSGLTLDLVNFLVTNWDFLYLGGTKSVLRFFVEGAPIIAHVYKHSNTEPNTIVGTPSQPIRAEIRQLSAGSATLKFLCAQVTSNGDSSQLVGFPVGLISGDGRIGLSSSGVRYVMIAYRLKSGFRDLSVFQEAVTSVIAAGANETFHWELRINPTLAAGSYTWQDADVEGIEFHQGTGAQTVNNDGYLVATGDGGSRANVGGAISKLRRIGTKIDGTSDIAVFLFVPHNNTQDAHGTISVNVL